jgi:uncharacterized repeat protein (TIGR01451 family)
LSLVADNAICCTSLVDYEDTSIGNTGDIIETSMNFRHHLYLSNQKILFRMNCYRVSGKLSNHGDIKKTFSPSLFVSFILFISLLISPLLVNAATPAIHAGEEFSISLKSDGTVWTWGLNDFGQLGNGTQTNSTTPVQVLNETGTGPLTNIIAIAGGGRHALAVKSDGTVLAWGWNGDGQMGIGTGSPPQLLPVQVSVVTDIVAVAAGYVNSLALKSDGTVWAWGDNGGGQIGDGTTTHRYTPIQLPSLSNVIDIVMGGGTHSMALKSDGTVWAWGANDYGQLGDGTTTFRTTPVQVSGIINTTSIGIGIRHSLAITLDGTVWAWGWNEYGQLGDGTTTDRSRPVPVPGLTDMVAIEGGGPGGFHTTALKSDGTVWTWGFNHAGQLGDGTNFLSTTPIQVIGMTDVFDVYQGGAHSLALKTDGSVWAWGGGGVGALGNGTTVSSFVPVQTVGEGAVGNLNLGASNPVPVAYSDSLVALESATITDTLRVVDVAGSSLTYSIETPPTKGTIVSLDTATGEFAYTGNVNATGSDSFTFKANDGTSDSNIATITIEFAPTGISPQLAAGDMHSLVLKNDGTIWAWGDNQMSQLGNGSTLDSPIPVQVSGLTSVTEVAGGMGTFSLALRSDGTVWAWGLNGQGQLGDGTLITRSVPIQVTGLTGMTAVAGAQNHSLALKSDGTVWAWGDNDLGTLGDGTTSDYRVTAGQVSGLTGVIAIAGGDNHSLALKSDGTVWAWGLNSSGQLGDGTTTNKTTPVQVTGLTSVIAITAGYIHSLALKSDGTVWAWGSNSSGQLGDGTTTSSSVPVQVLDETGLSALTGVTKLAIGGSRPEHSFVLKSDGTALAWGNNEYGQLGDGTNLNRSLPVQVFGLSDIIDVARGQRHSMAMNSDGHIWAWGWNNQNQLGDGTFLNRDVPIQVIGPDGVFPLETLVGNPLPEANDGNFTVDDVAVFNGILPGSDMANDPLTYSIVSQASKGVAVITNASTGAFSYTPNVGNSGADSFTYQVNDGNRDSLTVGTMSITITDTALPVATVTAPADGTTPSEVFLIEGTATDPSGLSLVQVQITDGTYYVDSNQDLVNSPRLILANGTDNWSVITSQVNWVLDTVYTVTARAIDNNGNVGISDPVSFTFSSAGGGAFTTCDLNLSASSILFNGDVDASMKLTRAGFPNENLSGSEFNLRITAPDTTETLLGPYTTNAFGQVTYQGLGTLGSGIDFNQKGAWTIVAEYDGNANLLSCISDPALLLVGSAAGYAVLVQGRISNNEGLGSHNKTTNRIYQTLIDRGFADQDIFYYNHNDTQTGVDGVPTKAGVQAAIEGLTTAVNINPAPMYVILVDHGGDNAFFLDGSETITPTELDSWLDTLETGLSASGLLEPRVVINGSCYSGSFIDELSGLNRLIVSSAAENEESYKGPQEADGIRSGEYFMEEFFQELGKGETFSAAFNLATEKTEVFTRRGGGSANSNNPFFDEATQHPLLDDDGDGIGVNLVSLGNSDGLIADELLLGTGPNFDTNSAENPAAVESVTDTLYINDGDTNAGLFAIPNDVAQVSQSYVEIRDPAVSLSAANGTEQLEAAFTRVQLLEPGNAANPFTDRFFTIYNGITTPGKYEVFYYVEDLETSALSPSKRSVIYKNKGVNLPPSVFNLLAPTNGATDKSVLLFDWEDATSDTTGDDVTDLVGVTYTLTIATDAALSNVVYQKEEITQSMFAVDDSVGLEDLTTYYWNVTAIDGFGAKTVSNNGAFSFSTDNQNNIPGIIAGIVHSDISFARLSGALVNIDGSGLPPFATSGDGSFIIIAGSGTVSMTTTLTGFANKQLNGIQINPGAVTSNVNFAMAPDTGDADLSVTLLSNAPTVVTGDSITYTATVTNNGPDTVSDATLNIALPGTTSFVSASAACGTPVGNNLSCAVASLANAQVTGFTVTVATQTAGSPSATATIITEVADSISANNSQTVQVTVLADTDNDGVPDINDAFPTDPNETTDTDGDGIGDNADTTYTVVDGNVSFLITAINAANDETNNPGLDIIELALDGNYQLTAIDNTDSGNTGLPTITSDILIKGNGATISGSVENNPCDGGGNEFRIFLVNGSSAKLTISNTTVSGGCTFGADGGGIAVMSGGSLNLNNSSVLDTSGQPNGGVFSNTGSVTISR